MKKTPATAAVAIAVLLFAASGSAQISITSGNLTYEQNFDNLLRTGTAETWVNDQNAVSANDAPRLVGLLGWHLAAYSSATEPSATYTPQIAGSAGGVSTGNFYSFGSSGAADRALGTLPTDGTTGAGAGSFRIGVRFANDTEDIIDGFSFSYDGEQWRVSSANNVNNQYVVAYATFGAGLGTLDNAPYSGTTIAGATFNTPHDGNGSTSSSLNGNDPANRVAGLGGTITDLSVMPGEEIWLRWFDANSSGLDHGIAIDNFSIAFTTIPIPEPSAMWITGLGALVLLNLIRRRSVSGR
jgi:hypothetical protein